jgi:hypothetical protein
LLALISLLFAVPALGQFFNNCQIAAPNIPAATYVITETTKIVKTDTFLTRESLGCNTSALISSYSVLRISGTVASSKVKDMLRVTFNNVNATF